MSRGLVKIFIILSIINANVNQAVADAKVERVILLADRNSCVSGDTVWFSTTLITDAESGYSNIIHVQLDGPGNRHITKSIIKTEGKSGAGYLIVPDSVSTGTYYLKAFSNIQKTQTGAAIVQTPLAVYNRFDENIESIVSPTYSSDEISGTSRNLFEINPGQTQYSTREEISFEFRIPDSLKNSLAALHVSVRLYDPFSDNIKQDNKYKSPALQTAGKVFQEVDGIIISGIITDAVTGLPAGGATVLLSISDSIPYFDFYFSDPDGRFYFYLKEMKGYASLVLQAVPQEGRTFNIQLSENYIELEREPETHHKMLAFGQIEFARQLIDASRFEKYFYLAPLLAERRFSRPQDFRHSFYGKPSSTIFTRDYIDLPDFREISKELLMFSKYRERKDTVFIKILNSDSRHYFTKEPLKLLDGIPVFDVSLFSDKSSYDIDRIDIVAEEKYYGDMIFNGIIAVYSPKPDLSWVDNNSRLFRFDFNTIQIPAEGNTAPITGTSGHLPDFRQVFLWEKVDLQNPGLKQSFRVGDRKGDIIIEISGIKKNGGLIRSNRIIKVK